MKTLSLTFLALVVSIASAHAADPCPFNEADYLALNPDVLAAVWRGDLSSGYDHYARAGISEGRAYNQYCGPIGANAYCPFDEQDYLAYNPDVAAAVYNGKFSSGADHFMHGGYRENRILSRVCERSRRGGEQPEPRPEPQPLPPPMPQPLPYPEHPVPGPCLFSEQDYLAYNPDVLAAVLRGNFSSGYDHYAKGGLREGRAMNRYCGPTPTTNYCPFVEAEYLAYNPDVAAAVYRGNFTSGADHFMHGGYRENRILSNTCAGVIETRYPRGPTRPPMPNPRNHGYPRPPRGPRH